MNLPAVLPVIDFSDSVKLKDNHEKSAELRNPYDDRDFITTNFGSKVSSADKKLQELAY